MWKKKRADAAKSDGDAARLAGSPSTVAESRESDQTPADAAPSSGSAPPSPEADAAVRPAAPEPPPASHAEAGDPSAGWAGRVWLPAEVPSWLTSMLIHMIALLVLALLTMEMERRRFDNDLTLGTPEATDELELFEEEALSQVEVNLDALSADASVASETDLLAPDPVVSEATDLEAAPLEIELNPIGLDLASQSDLMQEVGSMSGVGLEGRSAAERARLVREAGGSEGSEAAVKRALMWLKRHQNPDGSWSFFHLGGRCPCPGHGEFAQARNGATAIALLPFLGAGNTHKEGNYQKEVKAGLYFLLSQQKSDGSLWEKQGHMYSHGLAAIVLCEAYAMTRDKALQAPAQAALEFTTYAQDPIGGGWRYQPREPGDTSVVGWQLMALKSGHMAGLYVNPGTVTGASRFLDSVQAEGGATYGYMGPGTKAATSSIGLLCRMYLGWNRDHPALSKGVARLDKSGPSPVNLYYNYYATQVMRHYEGEPWETWNKRMRDWLVKQQDTSGHKEGSWYMGREHTDKGGRLYCTAMATMILEVYYRHLPIYRQTASEEEFPL
jgi:hypothetical protein